MPRTGQATEINPGWKSAVAHKTNRDRKLPARAQKDSASLCDGCCRENCGASQVLDIRPRHRGGLRGGERRQEADGRPLSEWGQRYGTLCSLARHPLAFNLKRSLRASNRAKSSVSLSQAWFFRLRDLGQKRWVDLKLSS